MAIKSLQKRVGLIVLLTVGLLMFMVGILGFIYMRVTLFEEWKDASIMKLQRAAHQIDMKLGRVNDWIQMFHKTAQVRGGSMIQSWILQ